jgi:hypothetical protein
MWESAPSRSIMPCPLLIVTQVTHGYLTSLTLQPLDQHLLAPHLIHGTVEQRIHVLLLLLTNLPLDGVASKGGYVGDLQMQDTGYLTSVSIDGEYTFSTFSERREWLVRASATPSGIRYSRNLTGDSRASSLTMFQTLASTIS